MSNFCPNCFNVNPENCLNCANSNANANANNIALINNYKSKIDEYINHIPNAHYILEITKCCNYSEFMVIHKDVTLCDLYKSVSIGFQLPVNRLYVIHSNSPSTKMLIPNNANVTLRNLITSNSFYFKPVYPIEAKVVYKIYYDDGHCHSDHADKSDSDMVIDNCIIHP
jgi:hypothetical protein